MIWGKAFGNMARPKSKFMPTPRIWSRQQVACRLGKGEQWFLDHRPELEREGFPKADALLGGYDADAIEAWLDRRGGLAGHSGDFGLKDRIAGMGDGDPKSALPH